MISTILKDIFHVFTAHINQQIKDIKGNKPGSLNSYIFSPVHLPHQIKDNKLFFSITFGIYHLRSLEGMLSLFINSQAMHYAFFSLFTKVHLE